VPTSPEVCACTTLGNSQCQDGAVNAITSVQINESLNSDKHTGSCLPKIVVSRVIFIAHAHNVRL